MPFVPTRPKMLLTLGVGSRCKTNLLSPYRCVISLGKFLGKFIILIASKGHFRTQILHPIHNSSEIFACLSFYVTSMQIFPILFTGQYRLHSRLHFFGLHFSRFTIASLELFLNYPFFIYAYLYIFIVSN